MDDALKNRLQQRIASLSKEIAAEIAVLGITDELFAAVRKLASEEALLNKRYITREITEEDYFAQWQALLDRTPEAVIKASIKFAQAMADASS
jgi:hypothetical protein